MKKIINNSLNSFLFSILISSSVSAIKIRLDLGDELSQTQRNAFNTAQKRWESILINDDLSAFEGNKGYDVVIKANAQYIDGIGKVLGKAGPTHVRPGSHIPSQADMSFDSADLNNMERNGTLKHVILHEMGHALGFGTIWEYFPLTNGNKQNPCFLGKKTQETYKNLCRASKLSAPSLEGVPLENIGGRGTFGSHWKKSIFRNEIMTGSISATGSHPLSSLTLAAFEDMGYRVNYRQADKYFIPTPTPITQQFATLFLAEENFYSHQNIPVVYNWQTICPEKVYYSKMESDEDGLGSFCNIF